MGTQRIESFFPDVDAPELEDALEALLPRLGYSVAERVTLDAGGLYPALGAALDRHPGAGAITVFARPPDARAPAALLDTHAAPGRRWDPALTRALSKALGGYAVAVEAWRAREQHGRAVFYAGHTIELEGSDFEHGAVRVAAPRGSSAPLEDERAHAEHVRCWQALTEGDTAELQPGPTTRARSWILRDERPLADAYLRDADGEALWSRAAFGPVDAPRFRDALQASAPAASGRWLPRATWGAEVPFVLLDSDGPLNGALVSRLASRLDCFVAAVELRGPGSPFRVLHGVGEAIQTGEARGAEALTQLWRELGVCLGTSPGAVRWPLGARGEPAGR